MSVYGYMHVASEEYKKSVGSLGAGVTGAVSYSTVGAGAQRQHSERVVSALD